MKLATFRIRCASILSFLPRFLTSLARRAIAALAGFTLVLSVVPRDVLAQLSEPRIAAQHLTQSFVALNARLQRAGAAERPKLLDELVALATEREELLRSLIEHNPGAALEAALPPRLRERFPDAVTPLVESATEIAGELQVLHVDFDGVSQERNVYILQNRVWRALLATFRRQNAALDVRGADQSQGDAFPGR